MKTREITSLALKLFALYLLVEALTNIPSLIGIYMSAASYTHDDPSYTWLWAVGLCAVFCAILVSILIWKLANKVYIESLKIDGDSKILNIVPSDFELIVFSALGLFLFVSAITGLSFTTSSAFASLNKEDVNGLAAGNILIIIANLFEMAIAITLVLYPSKWSLLLSKVRR